MTTPLLDFAACPQSAPRCLVLAESDRARTGSSVAVLFRDPSTASAHWPVVLAAYRRIWSGYKAHAPVMSATALLTQVADSLAAETELLEHPDLVVAFATVEGGEFAAWGLGTALVLVRQGEDLLELGPVGFTPVPAAGPIARAGEGRGLWHGRIEVGPETAVCLVERATAARLGWWRLRHALGSQSSEDILADLGLADDLAVAGRVIKSPHLTGSRTGSAVESRFVAAPPQADPPQPDEEYEPGAEVFLRPARRHREEKQLSWLGESASDELRDTDGRSASDEFAGAEGFGGAQNLSGADHLARPEDETGAFIQGAEPSSAAGTPFPLGTDDWAVDSGTAWPDARSLGPPRDIGATRDADEDDGFVLAGRRARAWTERIGPGTRESIVAWTSEMLDSLGKRGDSGRIAGGGTLVRRAAAWTVLGVCATLTVAFLILVTRFITGPRPEGNEVRDLPLAEATAPGTQTDGSREPSNGNQAKNSRSDSPDGVAPAPASFTSASWTRRFPQAITSSPLVHGDHLIVGCRDGNLYGLDLADGGEQWRVSAGSGIGSSPTAAGPLAVVGSYGGDVIGVDAATGVERWRTATGGKVVSSPAYLASAGIIAIGSHDKMVYGLSAKDGAVRWRAKTEGVVWASPTVAGKRILIGSHDGTLYCLDGETGRVEWRAPVGGPIFSTAAVWRDRVIVGSADREIRAFDLERGRLLWSHRAPGMVAGPVVIADDLALVGADSGDLLALGLKDGARRYTVRTGGAVKSRPVVEDGRIWFTSYDGRLRVVDLESGQNLWSFAASGQLYSSPAVLGRTAFFGSMDGTFYAATWARERAGL